jgi:hypothetical protein
MFRGCRRISAVVETPAVSKLPTVELSPKGTFNAIPQAHQFTTGPDFRRCFAGGHRHGPQPRTDHGFRYGRTDLVEITSPLKPEDVPIRPGETHIFTIAERFVRGWERIVREDNVHQPKKVQVLFQFINFGDGTGFWGTTAAPLPHPKRIQG